MASVKEIIAILEKEYPNDIMSLKGKNETEVAVYVAQIEMIEYIKSIEEQS